MLSFLHSLNINEFDADDSLPDFAINHTYDAVYLVGSDLSIKMTNEKALRLLGYSRLQMKGLIFSDIDDELNDADVAALWWKLSSRPEGITFTSQHTNSLGERIPVEVNSCCYRHEDREYILCIIHDIRELQRKETLYREREKQFRTLVENSPDMIARFDLKMRCLYVNSAVLALLQCAEEDVLGHQLTETVPLDDLGMKFFRLISHELANPGETEGELRVDINNHATIIHVRCISEYNMHAERESILAVGRDITRLRQADEQQREAYQQLRLLARKQEAVREEERKHLAREIHDELGQHLTSLRVGLSLIQMQATLPVDELQVRVGELMSLIDNTIQVVRDVSTRLRPNMLNMGLVPALEWLRDEFIKNNRCDCVLISPEEEQLQLDDESSTAAFRVVQESLTNIARHASASQVQIVVKNVKGNISLKIKDDGVGFYPKKVGNNAFGLLSMQERGKMLGGRLKVASTPGKGTLVHLVFPLQTNTDTDAGGEG